MKHYKVGNLIYAYEEDGSQDHLIPPDAELIKGDVNEYIRKNRDPKELKEEENTAIKAEIERIERQSLRALREAVLTSDLSQLQMVENQIKAERAKIK